MFELAKLPVFPVELVPTKLEAFKMASESPRIAIGRFKPVGSGQCVDFVQANGYGHLNGNAWEWVKYINSSFGWIGSAVVLNEGKGHVALIIGTDGGYNLAEQNVEGLPPEETSKNPKVNYRTIPFNHDKILGFIFKLADTVDVR